MFEIFFSHFENWKWKKKKIQTSNRTMSTSILFVCRYERYFLSFYFLCPPVCMKCFDLFLAVIPSHRYIDFVAPTADFMIFVTWIWNLVVFNWLFFLGPSCDFCHCDSGLPLGATFQPASHMWCSKLLWELGEDDPSCSCDTRYQCEAAPQHHGPPLCFTLAGVGANKP